MRINCRNLIKNISLIILLLSILPNDYRSFMPLLDKILYIFPMFFLLYVFITRKKTFIAFIIKYIYILIPFVVCLITTIVYSGDVILAFFNIYKIVYICTMVFYYYNNDLECLYITEKCIFGIMVLNLIVYILHPTPISYSDSGGEIFLIFEGNINKLVFSEICLLFLLNKKTKTLRFIIILCSILIWGIDSSTAIIGVLIYCIYKLIIKIKNSTNIVLNYRFIYFALIVMYLLTLTGVLNEILALIFHKTHTLSGRTVIWSSLINVIKSNPLFGVGILDSNVIRSLTGITGATHAHNQLIQILLNSGFIGLTGYIVLFKKISLVTRYAKKNKFYENYLGYIIMICICSISGVFFDNFFYFVTLILLNHLNLNMIDMRTKHIIYTPIE